MRAHTMLSVVLVVVLCAVESGAFYLPGVVPRDYKQGAPVTLKVNKLDSVQTQLPYDYYKLPFCRPARINTENENLGEILAGDRIETSAYEIAMRVPQACTILCEPKTYTPSQLKQFADKIEDGYSVNWIVDNMPAVTKYYTVAGGDDSGGEGEQKVHYDKGFDLGFVGNSAEIPRSKDGVKYINNHVRLNLLYHFHESSESNRIVGFEVEPFSVRHELETPWTPETDRKTALLKTFTPVKPVSRTSPFQPVSFARGEKPRPLDIVWTYDVTWMQSSHRWATRWDMYLNMADSQIHWFSIVNSIMIVVFLTGMIAMIMMRTLHRDFLAYNAESIEEQAEETGWKLLHADVFRPPDRSALFSVFVGSGVQIICCTVLTLCFALLGFLSPANRGGLMTALLLLFVFMGVFAGYYSTKLFKMFKLTEWKQNTLWTATFFPGACFAVFFVLNALEFSQGSSGAVPFGTLVALLVLWFGISTPLVYIGSWLAFRKPAVEPVVPVNPIPRMVPDQAWFMKPVFSSLVGGVLPFGAVFIEVFFIMSSVWLHQFYYVFGFLFIVFVILAITCAEISIVMCYFQLCGEDHYWWWRSFFTSGSSAIYLFAYSALYWGTKLEVVKLIPAILYFGYMGLCSFAFFLLTGTIGFAASYWFVSKIYSSVKVS